MKEKHRLPQILWMLGGLLVIVAIGILTTYFIVSMIRTVWRGTQAAPESSSTATPKTVNANAARPPAPETSAADTTLRKPALSGAALFVQVGAFAQEANASKLAESLRQENFPAFIITSPNGAFYLVHVGPYADEKSARIALGELGRAGFKPFIQH